MGGPGGGNGGGEDGGGGVRGGSVDVHGQMRRCVLCLVPQRKLLPCA